MLVDSRQLVVADDASLHAPCGRHLPRRLRSAHADLVGPPALDISFRVEARVRQLILALEDECRFGMSQTRLYRRDMNAFPPD